MHIHSSVLYFIRHGQTNSNANHIKQGISIDDYLNTQGVIQIQHLGPIVKLLDLDVLFTSYLHRAEETAALLRQSLKDPVPVMHDFRLRERDFGRLAGKTENEIATLLPNFRELEFTQMYDYSAFGGESVADVRQRALSALLDIAENNQYKHVGIVTHGGIIRLLLFHFPEIPRIFREESDSKKIVANADIYEWHITDNIIENLRSLLR